MLNILFIIIDIIPTNDAHPGKEIFVLYFLRAQKQHVVIAENYRIPNYRSIFS